MRQDLPEQFKREMRELLGGEYDAYLAAMEKSCRPGLRVNTLKWKPEEAIRCLGLKPDPIPWTANGFYCDPRRRLSKDPYYFAGLYYLQEPSAMAPAQLLPVRPGDRVLDLCAAPGGKSTELGARLRGEGLLWANDISSSRAKALLKNLELFGIPNLYVSCETPRHLAECCPEFFDRILVDAPCSGEGMFRQEPDMVKAWLERGPEYYAPIQQEILRSAVSMLRPGGHLLYSTCTFSRLEDEENVARLLADYPEMELVPLAHFPGASEGIGLTGCLRLFPHRVEGEGHFMALLRKRGNARPEKLPGGEPADGRMRPGNARPEKLPGEKPRQAEKAELQAGLAWDEKRVLRRGDDVYYLPEEMPPLKGIRYLRTGLLVGTLRKGRFEPSQALAMVPGASRFADSVSFAHGDERVVRYLKGETVALNEAEEERHGWQLVCVEGHGLGFAKGNGRTLKNKYYPGWRWM